MEIAHSRTDSSLICNDIKMGDTDILMVSTESEVNPRAKRPKIELDRVKRPMIVPATEYRTLKLIHADALYNDNSFEFARLTNGRNLLISSEIYYVEADGSIEGPLLDIDLELATFVRVPGHDFVVSSFRNYSSKQEYFSITVYTLPDMTAISTIAACFRLEGQVQFITSDRFSTHGVGRVLIGTENLLYLVDVTSQGFARIISCVDMAACAALATLKGEKESYKGLASGLLLYHDPAGSPIAIISASGGRVVFLSMSGPQCIPSAIYAEFASSIPAEPGNKLKSFIEGRKLLPPPTRISFDKPFGVVLPLRVLHAHRGRFKCQNSAAVFDARIWKPTTGGSTKLVTVGTDACMAISNLDDGVCFSDECLPHSSIAVTGGSKFHVHRVAVHGDVAFTGSSLEKIATFWDLSTPINPLKISVCKKIGDEMRYGKFNIMCADFSDDGVLAFTNTNDCDDPTLSFIVPHSS